VPDSWITDQATVTATRWSDGRIMLMETFSHREEAGAEMLHTHTEHDVEGTCEPQELAWLLGEEYRRHV